MRLRVADFIGSGTSRVGLDCVWGSFEGPAARSSAGSKGV